MTPEATDLVALIGEAPASESARHQLWRHGDLSWLDHHGTSRAHYQACRRLGLRDGTRQRDWAPRGQVQLGEQIEAAYARGIRRFVGEIGRRWGKSHKLLARAMQRCLRTPGARIPYAASTSKSVEEFIAPIAREIASTAPSDMRPELVSGEVRFPNGSRIPLQGCDDQHKADNLRGPAAHEAIVDEAAFIPAALLEYIVESVLKFQLGTTDGMMLIFSSAADTPAHYFVGLCERAQRVGAYMHATIYDGPMLTPVAIARLCAPDALDPDSIAAGEASSAWQREALARNVVDSVRAIVPEFDVAAQSAIVRSTPMPSHYHAYVVGDLGYIDLTVVLFAYYHFDDAVIVVEDELVLERSTSDVIQAGVDRIEALRFAQGCVDKPRRTIDAAPITRADMARAGEAADHAWQPPRKIDKEASVNALREAVRLRKIRIDPRCAVTLHHLRAGIWNRARTDFDRSEGLGHFDAIDALRYLVREVAPYRNLNPHPPTRYNPNDMRVPEHLRNPMTGIQAAFDRPRKR